MARKILLFSPPFNGHLNVLKNLIWKYQGEFDFHLVITGWKNITPDLKEITIPVTVLSHADLNETDPALWTLPRVAELLEDCINVAKKEKPDLILYDYFSLEGNFVGKILGIPYWSSIPALMGPFIHREYLQQRLNHPTNLAATNYLQQKFPDVFDSIAIEMISDGLHIPGQKNLIWSYPTLTPDDWMTNRHTTEHVFVGYIERSQGITVSRLIPKRPLVYFSFGTVVMDNLWNQQADIREKLKNFISYLANLTDGKEYDVLFVHRAKPLLDNYPKNWKVVEYADQTALLSQASVFVTHAGGNSFHEAVLKKVPMVAIPFFGDQPLVANRIEELCLGKNLVPDNNIDTRKSKDFLNEFLAKKVCTTIEDMLSHPDRYRHAFGQLVLESEDVFEVLSGESLE